MATPIGADDPWASTTDVINRCDVRTLGDFLSDTGTRLSADEVRNSEILVAFAREASGEVEAALLVGERYSLDDLNSLTGNSLQMLIGMVCGLILQRVFDRRPDRQTPEVQARLIKWAQDRLEDMRRGDRILSLLGQAAAGHAHSQIETAAEVEARFLVTQQAERFFGIRSNRRFPNGNTGGYYGCC